MHLPRFVESFGKIVNFLQCLFNVFLLGILFGVEVELDCFLFSIFVRCYKELGDISSCTWGLEESTLVVGVCMAGERTCGLGSLAVRRRFGMITTIGLFDMRLIVLTMYCESHFVIICILMKIHFCTLCICIL